MKKHWFQKVLASTAVVSMMAAAAFGANAEDLKIPQLIRSFDKYDEGYSVPAGGDKLTVSNVASTGWMADRNGKALKLDLRAGLTEAQVAVDVPESVQDWSAYADGWLTMAVSTASLKVAENKNIAVGVRLVDGDGVTYSFGQNECTYMYGNYSNGWTAKTEKSGWGMMGFDIYKDKFISFKLSDLSNLQDKNDKLTAEKLKDIKQIILVLNNSGNTVEDGTVYLDDMLLSNTVDIQAGGELVLDGLISWDAEHWPVDEAALKAPDDGKDDSTDESKEESKDESKDESENESGGSSTPETGNVLIPMGVLLAAFSAASVLMITKKKK